MRSTIHFILLAIFILVPAPAQSPSFEPRFPQGPSDYLLRELLLRQLENDRSDVRRAQESERRTARDRELRFINKANNFVSLWESFVHEYNRQGAFNVKAAKAASKAFHELERSEGWIGPELRSNAR
jgi:hypothetical protein